jgi:hypothetical protein
MSGAMRFIFIMKPQNSNSVSKISYLIILLSVRLLVTEHSITVSAYQHKFISRTSITNGCGGTSCS